MSLNNIYIIFLFIILAVVGYNTTRYEGKSAKEWHSEYVEAEDSTSQIEQQLEDQTAAWENEAVFKQCIDKADKFYAELFDSTCSKMEREKNMTRKQCSALLVSNGAIANLTRAKESSGQECFKAYLDNR